jgi:hypothetical protein
VDSALNRTREVVGERQRIRRLAVETPGDVLAKLGSGSKADHRIVTIEELSGPSDDPDIRTFDELRGAQATGPAIRVKKAIVSSVRDVGNKTEKFSAAGMHLHLVQKPRKNPPCGEMMRERRQQVGPENLQFLPRRQV